MRLITRCSPSGSGIGSTRFALGGAVEIAATVSNTGARAGEELIRVDVHQRVDSGVRPVRQMKASARPRLAAAGATVVLRIAYDNLAMFGADGRWRVEPGLFDLWVDAGEGTTLATRYEALAPRANG